MSPSAKVQDLFEQLTTVASGTAAPPPHAAGSNGLDEKTRGLAVLGAAICADSPTATFKLLVASAREHGATEEEILGVLLAVAPSAGQSRVVAVTPRISKALGYDVDDAFERE